MSSLGRLPGILLDSPVGLSHHSAMPNRPSHAELELALASLRLGVHASDLQGSLSGYFCAGGRAGVDDWPDALQLDVDAATLSGESILQRLYLDCREQFEGPCADVTPLLPVETAPLAQRVDALAQWCRGFLGGCGLTGALSHSNLAPRITEILADFHSIAVGRFDANDNSEDEQAFADVLDFVRTAAAWLHREIGAGGHSVHVVH